MKLKNIVHIVALTGLIATESAQSMCVNGLKKITCAVLQKVGTLVGVGWPTIPFIKHAANIAYETYNNPAANFPDTLKPLSTEHEAFYKKLGGDVEIRTLPDDGDNTSCGYNRGKLVVVPEKLYISAGLISLEEALASNNTDALAAFEGTYEHEYQHYLNKDSYRVAIQYPVIPIVTTAIAAICFKKTFPASITVAQYAGRCATKILAGSGLYNENKEAVRRYTAYASRKQEFAADEGVSKKNIPAFLESIELSDINNFLKHAKKQYPKLTEPEQIQKASELRKQSFNSPYTTHPSYEKRREALENRMNQRA
jgi:hypothetical protein